MFEVRRVGPIYSEAVRFRVTPSDNFHDRQFITVNLAYWIATFAPDKQKSRYDYSSRGDYEIVFSSVDPYEAESVARRFAEALYIYSMDKPITP